MTSRPSGAVLGKDNLERREGQRSILIQAFVIVPMVVAFYIVPNGVSPAIIWTCLVIVYVTGLQLLWRPSILVANVPTYATIEVLFFIFYYLIYYWPYQQYLIWGSSLGRSAFLTTDTFVGESNRSVLLATIGLAAFYIGSQRVPALISRRAAKRPTSGDGNFFARSLIFLALTGQVLSISAYLAFGLTSAGEGRYTESATGGPVADGVSLIILMFSMVLVALGICRRARHQRLGLALLIGCGISGIWAIRILLLGDRNSFLLLAIVAIGGVYTFLVKAGRIVLACSGAAALTLYNAVELSRSSGPSLAALLDALIDPERKVRPGLNDSSFNITTITVRAGLAAVPSYYDYGQGWFKLVGFAGVVPLIRGALLPGVTGPLSSADLLGDVMLGRNASWNVGSNVVTDVYVDFGVVGVLIAMFVVGVYCGYVRQRLLAAQRSPSGTVYYLVSLALIAELPRYTLDSPVRILCWIALLIAVARWLSRRD